MRNKFILFFSGIGLVMSGIILYLLISTNIDKDYYDFKNCDYSHEIDSVFNKNKIERIVIRKEYKSDFHGSIYYAYLDSLTHIIIIDAKCFKNVSIKNVNIKEVAGVRLKQGKSYKAIIDNSFPVVEQMLKPRQSNYLNIVIEKPCQYIITNIGNKYKYFRGDFNAISFGNSQNISVLTFNRDKDIGCLVLNYNGEIYVLVQTGKNTNLLEIINPVLLK